MQINKNLCIQLPVARHTRFTYLCAAVLTDSLDFIYLSNTAIPCHKKGT